MTARTPLRRNQDDVRALEVGVHDAGAMRRLQSFRELDRDRKGLVARQPSGADRPASVWPWSNSIAKNSNGGCASARRIGCPDLEDAADVGMGHPAGDRDLLMKALQERLIACEIATQCLERDLFIEEQVVGLVHLAHAAAADEPGDAIALSDDVAGEACAKGGRQSTAG